MNKNIYYTITVSEIVLAALIPVIGSLPTTKKSFIMSIIGGLLTILTGLKLIGRYQEKWLDYRKITEKLKREKQLFLYQVHPYDSEDALKNFVTNIENDMYKETIEYITKFNAKKSKN